MANTWPTSGTGLAMTPSTYRCTAPGCSETITVLVAVTTPPTHTHAANRRAWPMALDTNHPTEEH
jgi:hypothetical protein